MRHATAEVIWLCWTLIVCSPDVEQAYSQLQIRISILCVNAVCNNAGSWEYHLSSAENNETVTDTKTADNGIIYVKGGPWALLRALLWLASPSK